MRLKDSRKTSAPSATVWWNVRMMRLRLVGRRLGLVALVLVPVLRLAVLVLCLVLRLIPVPMGLLVLHLFRPVLRRLTTKWRNTCDRAIRSCSATCCTRPAISCTTVSPCPTAGTKHKAPKSGKPVPIARFPRSGRFRHERRLLEASVLFPTASRLHPHLRTSVFAHISLYMADFES